VAVGGGAVLDAVGFCAAMAHRGMRLIRIASTTLAQADSAMGVKNGINAFGKKNYLGAFTPPWAVINDESLLPTLDHEDWISGFSEAVKVALLKDAALFAQLEAAASRIAVRDMDVAIPVIRRSAQLHFEHITRNGDPFELTAARPLDFGHWAAHRLEHLTDYQLPHGHAVAIGMALDLTYAMLMGWLARGEYQRVIRCLSDLGFELYHPAMSDTDKLLAGVDEFREHLGGALTIPMVGTVGSTFDVHHVEKRTMLEAIDRLGSAARRGAEAR
jgi:3-dehydroquinate synthase